MADEPDNKPERRDPVPWALRLTFTPVLLVIMLLLGVRMLNGISIYPPVEMDRSLAPKLAAQDDGITEIHFEADDGQQLYGWVVGSPDARRHIIACTGNAEHVGLVAPLYLEHALALDARILLFDYRGYGNSSGSPSEVGLYSDSRGAYRYAVNELHWRPEAIILWGRSLGSAPAIKLAYDLLAEDRPESLAGGVPPKALILEAPFTSIHDMAQAAMPHLIKPEWLIYEFYDNLSRAPKLALPVFHYQGDNDEVIPFGQGETLFEALPGPKQHLTLTGVGHNDIWGDAARAKQIRQGIDEFLRAHE